MSDQIYIGNFAKGLKLDREPFNIDNDAFPVLFNAYSWRGRAKRKRGTALLGQLRRQVQSVLDADPTKQPWQYGQLTRVDGLVNLISGSGITLETNSTIVPGSINLTVLSSSNLVTDLLKDGTIQIGASTVGTINYATGQMFFSNLGAGTLTGTYSYYPRLPVMGLRDFSSTKLTEQYPALLAFDTKYSYQIFTNNGFYSTSYYKGTNNPVVWTGADFAQFFTCNYSGALWATNNKPGFHFMALTNTLAGSQSVIQLTPTTAQIGLTGHGLIVGDIIWINEVTGTIGTGSGSTANQNINLQTGTVTTVVDANTIIATFSANFQVGSTGTGGIAQYLTTSVAGQDGIRWYDGDPTAQTGLPTGTGLGWVNFSPPLTVATVSIDNTPKDKYYLVGALAILPFKDFLLFFSPYIATSSGGVIQLSDTVLWSWNGTPFYTSLVPLNQTFSPTAYYVDQTGLGGYLPAGISNPIVTISDNEDVLLIGFGGDGRKTRFVFTGNKIQPFLFYNINSELPSTATFSAVTLDKGALDIGAYGLALTDQQSSQRIDLDIPDVIFSIQSLNNGMKRVNAIRDFFREWIYFSYPIDTQAYEDGAKCVFPLQTLLFNYRDNTWAILYENYTTHGTYREQTKKTWATLRFKTWNDWREPWGSGSSSSLFPDIIAGNPQGYVMITDEGTGEDISGSILGITDDGVGKANIFCNNHCVSSATTIVQSGDYLYFQGALGIIFFTITNISLPGVYPCVLDCVNTFLPNSIVAIAGVVGMTQLNGNQYTLVGVTPTQIFLDVDTTGFTPYASGGTASSIFNNQIVKVVETLDADHFIVDLPFPQITYLGLGSYTRLSQPLMLTKQFTPYWDQGRKTRLSVQKYLMDTTDNAQVTVNIYLSQNENDPWNNPANAGQPNGLVYSRILYTCPESTNIGLTPANVNLQMPTAINQQQIWHRMNTSLIGDSIQVGITLSDEQMRNLTFAEAEITLNGIHLLVDKGPQLA